MSALFSLDNGMMLTQSMLPMTSAKRLAQAMRIHNLFGNQQLEGSVLRLLTLETGVRVILLSILPFLSLYFVEDSRLANLTITIFLLAGIFGGIILGRLADIFREDYVILTALLVLALALAPVAVFEHPPLVLYLTCIGISGFALRGIEVPFCGLYAHKLPSSVKKYAFQFRYWLGNISGIIGIALGWLYVSQGSIRLAFLGSILIATILLIVALYNRSDLLKENNTNNPDVSEELYISTKKYRVSWRFCLLITSGFVTNLAHQQLTSNVPLYLHSAFANASGLYSGLLVINSVILIAIHAVVFTLTKKSMPCHALGLMLVPLGMLFFGMHSQLLIVLGIVLYSVGETVVFPALNYLSEQHFPHHLKSSMFGVMGISRLGLVLGSLWGWWVQAAVGYENLFTIAAVLLGVSVTVIFYEERYFRKDT